MARNAACQIAALQALVNRTETVLPTTGFVSEEFRFWHAEVCQRLREFLGEQDPTYREFLALQFEWLPEPIGSFENFFNNSGEIDGSPQGHLSEEIAGVSTMREKAMRQTLDGLSEEKKNRLASAVKQFQSADFPFRELQERKFISGLARSKEILLAAIVVLRNDNAR